MEFEDSGIDSDPKINTEKETLKQVYILIYLSSYSRNTLNFSLFSLYDLYESLTVSQLVLVYKHNTFLFALSRLINWRAF